MWKSANVKYHRKPYAGFRHNRFLFLLAGGGRLDIVHYRKRRTGLHLDLRVVSALSTVGLSLNFSPLLSISGKLVIIFTMLVGRIGILAFFISFYKEYKKKNYTYPQENILM